MLDNLGNCMAVLVSNIPAPYREIVFEAASKKLSGKFVVLYCKNNEPDRQWEFNQGAYDKFFLDGFSISYSRHYTHFIHFNTGVWRKLTALNPDVVITNGYNPTHLIAFVWAKFNRRAHIPMTDGWLGFERHLTVFHRLVRKIIISGSHAFIGASKKSLELFQFYGAHESACFSSYLCGNNDVFLNHGALTRQYDLMFSGRFIDIKMPLFFCEVARLLKNKRGSIRVLLIGDGPLRSHVLNYLDKHNIDYFYPGFVAQKDLAVFYSSSKLLIFPTLLECWGVVANEACAAGTPVLTCENTAVAGELVQDQVNGRVLPLDEQIWADAADYLLDNPICWSQYSQNAREIVSKFSYAQAASGLVNAIRFAERELP